jgi:hypothetical protein
METKMKRLLLGLMALMLMVAPAAAQNVNAGQYQVTPSTWVDGQKGQLLTDVNGRAIVMIGGTVSGGTAEQIQGSVASGATDSGNPVKTGGVYNSSLPSLTTGQRVDTQTDISGNTRMLVSGFSTTAADAVSNSNTVWFSSSTLNSASVRPLGVAPLVFNGTSWDRIRSVITGTDSVGTGIQASGILAQLDDTSPNTVTENQFGNVRMTPNRSLMVAEPVTTITTSVTRPADGIAYAANDAYANSTSAPTAGGYTLTGACAVSGGNGTIQSAMISASGGTAYNGELWIFDQAATATNDNAALSVSDSDVLNMVGVIPFNTTDVNAANAISYVTGLNIGYTCVGTANLRFLVKILSAVTPANAEVLSVRVQVRN